VVAPEPGSVVLVSFPFSDLSATKRRPAVVLASAGRGDSILCQVTSNPYADPDAFYVVDDDFAVGSLQRESYARPGKLFTANASLVSVIVGTLRADRHRALVEQVVALLRSGSGGQEPTQR